MSACCTISQQQYRIGGSGTERKEGFINRPSVDRKLMGGLSAHPFLQVPPFLAPLSQHSPCLLNPNTLISWS